ncbi:methyl-accepting chemotaxis protein [Pseudothauera nasutitermitis]|uniref:Methyl-accepting chemotaxis protein n=1 Tax=Pseudothauera nasutitermitis TaxID=2565930 RepID=A0A4V3WCF4_9RHOO|nr:methyl-accepting chemotaxis protein [Pseudothauera nasutitermitis]THF66934.1 methyl-accepting chemotaxis protein [Pseudothauera nasutitermitis]
MLFKSMSVMHRFVLVLVVALAGTLLLSALALQQYRARMVEDYQRAVRSLVEVAHGVVAHYHEEERTGRLGRAEAQEAAKAALRGLRYDGVEYFWINDSTPRMVMHPIRPELDGRDLGGDRDPTGKYLFREFVRVASTQGAGFVDYLWPKPGAEAPQPKLSYVKQFQPWDWVIGSGIYVDDIRATFFAHLYQFAAVVLGLMVLLGFFVWRVVRGVINQLGGEPAYAAEVMRSVAGGDLTVDVRAGGDRDSLLGALAQMVAGLRGMVGEIGANAERVTGNAHELSGVSRSVAEASHGQSSAASSIAAAVEQMTTSISHISDSARETEDNSARAAVLAEQGEARADEAMREMEAMSATVERAAEKIRELVARADEIGSIAGVIKEIATQTDLLALNAAIEAARAGEQGRGFAVVADEVRSLAERTANATVQIGRMIASIQADTRSAVDVMGQAAGQVHAGVELVQGAAGSLREIRSGTGVALERIRAVAGATREQTAVSAAIGGQVEHIARMVEGTSDSMGAAVEVVDELERLAVALRDLVGRFRY